MLQLVDVLLGVHISSLHRDAFMVDPEVVHEYDRLQQIATRPLSIT